MTNKTAIFNPLSLPTYVMAKPIGSTCNLNCSYCYYLEKEKLYENRHNFQMSDEVLEQYIESYIQAQPVPEVLFVWHGGEPLLRGIAFFRKIILFQKKYGRGRKISNSLQTNGTLLNKEWCLFFRENGFLIGISIDGPEHCHDYYRKNKRGQPTFKQVMQGIELMKKYGVEFNILSVINNYNVNFPIEIYRFFKNIGGQFLQFSPIVERISTSYHSKLNLLPPEYNDDETKLVSWSVDPVKFGEFYIRLFDEWVKNDVGKIFVQLFDATLANMVGVSPGVCLFAETCGHAGVMEFNGDVYSCDHYVFPEFKIGNVKNQTIFEMMFQEKQLHFGDNKRDTLPIQCVKCEVVKFCHGECPKNRIIKTPTGETGLNYLCAGYKSFFKHVYPYMEFMANELANKRPPSNVMEWAKSR